MADGCLKLKLAAPAQEGRANAELIRFLAKTLGKCRAEITVELGAGTRRKLVRIAAVTANDVASKFGLTPPAS